MNCRNVRKGLESGVPSANLELHLSRCASCREYQSLQVWSRQVVLQGEIEATAPPMSAIWASIQRAAEQSWDTALTLSFRRLLPYLVTIAALLLVVAGLVPSSTTPVTSRGAAVLLNSTDSSSVLTSDLTVQAPGDMLGLTGR
jgi:predicted anti-sigma-YlaC factor YlaD